MKITSFIYSASIIVLLTTFGISNPLVAQNEDVIPSDTVVIHTEREFGLNDEDLEVQVKDTTVISLGKQSMVIIKDGEGTDVKFGQHHSAPEKKNKTNWVTVNAFGLDFGITNYYQDGQFGKNAATDDLELKNFRPGSHVALHLLPTTIRLVRKGHVSLKTALTIDYNNYYFVNPITLRPNRETLTIETPADSSAINFSRNKLLARYFQVPFMISLKTKPNTSNSFGVSVGGYAGVLWHSKTKQVSEENGKQKIVDDFNLNPVRYGVVARLQYDWFGLYVKYNLSELFASGEGPSTQTFMVGVSIADF